MSPSDPPPPDTPPPHDPTTPRDDAPAASARVKVLRRGHYVELHDDDTRPTEPGTPVHGRREGGP